jgi:type IV pilus assembly protein PilQ
MGTGEDRGDVGLDIWLTRNRRSLIITARSDRYVDLAQVGKERAMAVPSECRCGVRFADGLLWVDAQNAPSRDVFGEISRAAGVKIVQSGVVDRRVSAYLPGVPVQAALEAIGRGYGLCIQPLEGAYTVTDGAARSPSVFPASVTRAIPVRNIRAETAVDLLPNFLTQYLHPEPTQNVIIATGPSCMLDKLEQDLRKIDLPAPRVEVRAIAVEADDLSDLEAALGFRSVQGTTAWGGDAGTGDITFHVARDLPEGAMAHLTALRESARFNVVSQSRATAGNGESAVLFVGDTHFFPFRTAWSYRQEVILERQDVGVSLSVQPVTGNAGDIRAFVNLQVKNVISVDSQGLPLVSSRRARGTVRARDGDTIYIGGVESEERHRARRKVPILGDLPLIGKAFRSRSTRTVRQELGFFITLHVVTEDETKAASAQASPGSSDGG